VNWKLEQFKHKDIVFVGAGKGRAMSGIKDFLERHGQIASFTGVDKVKSDTPLEDLTQYDPARTVFIKNEGIPGSEMPVPYITALQVFFSLVQLTGATTIGVTGTKGKSTTASLTTHILKVAGKKAMLAGNIGVSPLPALDRATKDTIIVLELSSYQLSDMRISPHISVCLNLYNDHTDWHGSLKDYYEAKHNIVRYAKSDDLFIYNPAFPDLRIWAEQAPCRAKPIDATESLDLSSSSLFGEHNRLNALAAREVARELDVPDEATQSAINTFQPLRHRMQVVATKHSNIYIDDAIGMTPESTIASLQAISQKFGQVGCLLLGGQDRYYDFTELFRIIAAQKVPNLVLFPDTIEKMKAAFPPDFHPNILETTTMQEAVTFAAQHAPTNSVVLLSTAAPSYSLWQDFEDKGDQFQTAVQALA